ncbi:peptidase inhibitor family I36 protein [Streptomyces sp. NPDC057674]|uniref:peptidase inhibitor family I36 protein n=1 Tax=Streptomyces sp. NPDC057674 TaxID=3346203 RepID=UPI0036C6DB54
MVATFTDLPLLIRRSSISCIFSMALDSTSVNIDTHRIPPSLRDLPTPPGARPPLTLPEAVETGSRTVRARTRPTIEVAGPHRTFPDAVPIGAHSLFGVPPLRHLAPLPAPPLTPVTCAGIRHQDGPIRADRTEGDPMFQGYRRKTLSLVALTLSATTWLLPAPASAAPTAAWACASGRFCVYSGDNGTGSVCSWSGDDADWHNGATVCSWTGSTRVQSVFNNGTSTPPPSRPTQLSITAAQPRCASGWARRRTCLE